MDRTGKNEFFDYEKGCILSIRCYGKRKWSVTKYGFCLETWWFDSMSSATLFAKQMSGLYSEWEKG